MVWTEKHVRATSGVVFNLRRGHDICWCLYAKQAVRKNINSVTFPLLSTLHHASDDCSLRVLQTIVIPPTSIPRKMLKRDRENDLNLRSIHANSRWAILNFVRCVKTVYYTAEWCFLLEFHRPLFLIVWKDLSRFMLPCGNHLAVALAPFVSYLCRWTCEALYQLWRCNPVRGTKLQSTRALLFDNSDTRHPSESFKNWFMLILPDSAKCLLGLMFFFDTVSFRVFALSICWIRERGVIHAMTRTFVESFELFHGPARKSAPHLQNRSLSWKCPEHEGIASFRSSFFIRKFLRFPFDVFRGLFLRWEGFLFSSLRAYVLILIHLSVLQLQISFMRCLSLRIVSWGIPSVLRSISISEGFAAPSSTSTCFQVLASFETTVFSLFLCFDLAHQLAPVSKCLQVSKPLYSRFSSASIWLISSRLFPSGCMGTPNRLWLLLLLLSLTKTPECYLGHKSKRKNFFEQDSISFLTDHSLDAILWHWIVHNHGIGFCLPKFQSKILRPWQFYSIHSILISFPIAVILDFSWFWKIFAGFFLIWICSKKLEGREEDFCLPSLLPFPPATSPVLRIHKWSYEQPWLMNSFQLWRITTCPSIQARWSFLQCVPESLEHTSVFLSKFRNIRTLSWCVPYECFRSQSLCQKFRAHLSPNALNHFRIIVSQWTAPSSFDSTWSRFLTILIDILKISADGESLSNDVLTGLLTHFLSLIRMLSFL